MLSFSYPKNCWQTVCIGNDRQTQRTCEYNFFFFVQCNLIFCNYLWFQIIFKMSISVTGILQYNFCIFWSFNQTAKIPLIPILLTFFFFFEYIYYVCNRRKFVAEIWHSWRHLKLLYHTSTNFKKSDEQSA